MSVKTPTEQGFAVATLGALDYRGWLWTLLCGIFEIECVKTPTEQGFAVATLGTAA